MRVRLIVYFGVVLAVLLLALIPGAAVSPTGWTVVAWNNLGMHCMDADFSRLRHPAALQHDPGARRRRVRASS